LAVQAVTADIAVPGRHSADTLEHAMLSVTESVIQPWALYIQMGQQTATSMPTRIAMTKDISTF
jgi:hypothetical protein